MENKETWRIIPSIDGLLASNNGRLMVLPYTASLPNGGFRQYGGYPTNGQWDGKRFIYVYRNKTYRVHRLICEAFNGKPENGQVCMHLDEDASNNRPDNLKWGTQKENLNFPKYKEKLRQRMRNRSCKESVAFD